MIPFCLIIALAPLNWGVWQYAVNDWDYTVIAAIIFAVVYNRLLDGENGSLRGCNKFWKFAILADKMFSNDCINYFSVAKA